MLNIYWKDEYAYYRQSKRVIIISIFGQLYGKMAFINYIQMFRVNRKSQDYKLNQFKKNSLQIQQTRQSFFLQTNKFSVSPKYKLKTQIDEQKSKFNFKMRKLLEKNNKECLQPKLLKKAIKKDFSLRASLNLNISKSIDRQKQQKNKLQKQNKLTCNKYMILEKVGSGTFGTVFKVLLFYQGISKLEHKTIAIKRVVQDKKYKNRQLGILKLLKHPNLIEMLDHWVATQEGQIVLYIVMQYYPQTLYSIIRQQKKQAILSDLVIKIYIWKLFRAMLNLNTLYICHRDIKPHNILINKLQLVVCDFGSSKIIHQGQENIAYICSRCYRAPQLIFGSTSYNSKIDIWSIGCVLSQTITNKPLFVGNSSVNQLLQIIKVIGTPTYDDIDQMNPQYNSKNYKIQKIKPLTLQRVLRKGDPLLIDLISKILVYSPSKRYSAQQAMAHEYFEQLRKSSLKELFNFSPEQIRQMGYLYKSIKQIKS